MSSDQVYYNKAEVILDGEAHVLIEDFVERTVDDCNTPVQSYTITVKDYEGKIAQEFIVRADVVTLVRL